MDSTTLILAGIAGFLFCIGAAYFISMRILNKKSANKS
jgi:nitrate reductase gamma subunit